MNTLGWKLTWLNQEDLQGKRGLIQRAVDSFRNRFPEMRSRRVVRQEKLIKGTLRKRSDRASDSNETSPTSAGHVHLVNLVNSKASTPSLKPHSLTAMPENPAKKMKFSKYVTIESISAATIVKTRLRCDIEAVSLHDIPEDFKRMNAVFPRALVPEREYQGPNFSLEKACNEVGWKLAWINSPRLHGKKCLLQRALDIYRHKFQVLPRPRRGKRAVEAVTNMPVTNVMEKNGEYHGTYPQHGLYGRPTEVSENEEDSEEEGYEMFSGMV